MNPFVDYHELRRFVGGSRLRTYLAFKKPESEFISTDCTTLYQVMQYLKELIRDEKLYDERNASIVLCDASLETALDVKALHLTELRDKVCLQLKPININRATQPPVVAGPAAAAATQPPVAAASSNRRTVNSNTKFHVKPAFREVLEGVNVPVEKTVFTFIELAELLSTYITVNSSRFFDARNVKVAMVDGDKLGAAFGVKAFHRTQVTSLLFSQLIPVVDGDGQVPGRVETEAAATVEQPNGRVHDDDDNNAEEVEESGESDDSLTEFEVDSDAYNDDQHDNVSSSEDYSDERNDVVVDRVAIKDDGGSEWWGEESAAEEDTAAPPPTTTATWKCLHCNIPNAPFLRFCSQCWNMRKGWLPPRPTAKKRPTTIGKRVSVKKLTMTTAAATTETDCTLCFSREKKAGIVHGGILHQISCYPCAKRLYKRKQPCPVCRRRIEKIVRIITC